MPVIFLKMPAQNTVAVGPTQHNILSFAPYHLGYVSDKPQKISLRQVYTA